MDGLFCLISCDVWINTYPVTSPAELLVSEPASLSTEEQACCPTQLPEDLCVCASAEHCFLPNLLFRSDDQNGLRYQPSWSRYAELYLSYAESYSNWPEKYWASRHFLLDHVNDTQVTKPARIIGARRAELLSSHINSCTHTEENSV